MSRLGSPELKPASGPCQKNSDREPFKGRLEAFAQLALPDVPNVDRSPR